MVERFINVCRKEKPTLSALRQSLSFQEPLSEASLKSILLSVRYVLVL